MSMNENIERKVIAEGNFEDVVEIQNHFYLIT